MGLPRGEAGPQQCGRSGLCDPTSQFWRCGAEEAALGHGAGLPHLPAELSLAVTCPSGGRAAVGEGLRGDGLSSGSQL